MKEEKLEKEKKGKSLAGKNEIRPACSQTCDRGLGERNELGRGFSEEERQDYSREEEECTEKMGAY